MESQQSFIWHHKKFWSSCPFRVAPRGPWSLKLYTATYMSLWLWAVLGREYDFGWCGFLHLITWSYQSAFSVAGGISPPILKGESGQHSTAQPTHVPLRSVCFISILEAASWGHWRVLFLGKTYEGRSNGMNYSCFCWQLVARNNWYSSNSSFVISAGFSYP